MRCLNEIIFNRYQRKFTPYKKQAAQRIGVSENLLEKWEKGEIKPDLVEGKKYLLHMAFQQIILNGNFFSCLLHYKC